ncbi:MAG: hypothetical protein BWY02_02861 [bacterium ADurb.Bin157]|nr:MAG: hypothetical protein BWY02_02861 [bacterium ADurb.Bin157]
MTARAFESYVIEKLAKEGFSNDFLANIAEEYDFGVNRKEDIYPYVKKSELDTVTDAFDNLFNTLKSEKTESGIKLYSVEYLVAKYAAQGLKQAAKVVRRGAALIHSGVKEFAKWARQLFNEFGQNVKKYLVGLYKDVTTAYNRQKLHSRRGAVDFRDKRRAKVASDDRVTPDNLIPASVSEDIENRSVRTHDSSTTSIPETDSEGNNERPVVLKSVSEMTDEDFTNPTRSVILPSLPNNTLKIIGSEKKPILIKQNILEKNKTNHKELTPEDCRKILNAALYDGDLIGQSSPKERPNYWVAVKVDKKNGIIVIDVEKGKTNFEIVGWRYANEKTLKQLKERALREGGQFLIQRPQSDPAAGLSTLTQDSSTTSIPETDSKVKPADKKQRLVKPGDFKWEKIDKDTYLLQFTDPDNGEMSTVADYFAMIASVSEVPLIDDAFYYAFCSRKTGSKFGSKISLDSPEGRSL